MMFRMKCRTTYDVSVHILNLPHSDSTPNWRWKKAQLNNKENAICSRWSIMLSIIRFVWNESFLNTKMTASTQAVNWNVERNIKTRRGNSRNVSNITHFYFLLFNPEWWWVTWSSGGPPSSLMSSKKLWPSTTTSFLNLPPSGDSSWMRNVLWSTREKYLLQYYLHVAPSEISVN